VGVFARSSGLTGTFVFVTACAKFDEDRIELVNHSEERVILIG